MSNRGVSSPSGISSQNDFMRDPCANRHGDPPQKHRRLADLRGRAHSPQYQWITLWEALQIGASVRQILMIRHLPKN